jgi:hypothetical protein
VDCSCSNRRLGALGLLAEPVAEGEQGGAGHVDVVGAQDDGELVELPHHLGQIAASLQDHVQRATDPPLIARPSGSSIAISATSDGSESANASMSSFTSPSRPRPPGRRLRKLRYGLGGSTSQARPRRSARSVPHAMRLRTACALTP